MTYVSRKETWEETRDIYIGSITSINAREQVDDSLFVKNKKAYFVKEINILKEITFLGKLSVYDVCFSCKSPSFHLQIELGQVQQ